MKITLEATAELVELDGVPTRLWVGETQSGIPVHAYIHRISPQTHEPAALDAFDRELQENYRPDMMTAVALNPLRDAIFGGGDDPVRVDFGPCCMCEAPEAANVILLDRRCAIPGHGWGCVVCGLPSDGAVAVLCEGCLELYRRQPGYLLDACRGRPRTEGRIPIEELPPGEFKHDRAIHAAADHDFRSRLSPAERALLRREELDYQISEDGRAITCGRCGMTSHNPHDVANRYCGNCHVFHEDRP